MKVLTIRDVRFPLIDKLGKGSFGAVYKTIYEGKEYALKVIDNNMEEGTKSLRELDIMTRLVHPNLSYAKMVVSDIVGKKNDKNKNY